MNDIYKPQNAISDFKHALLRRLLLATILMSIFSLTINAQQSTKIITKYFTSVNVDNMANVTLVNDDTCYILIKSKDFNPNKFSYEINDEMLSFDVEGIKNFSLDIEIASPNFKEIVMDGAGDLSSKTRLEGEELHIELSGASNVILGLDYNILTARLQGASDAKVSGFVDSMYINTSGASSFDSYETKTLYASVKANGASDVKINPDSTVVADISGTSSLRYKNNPTNKRIGQNESVWVGINDHSVYVSEDEDTIRVSVGGGDAEIIISDEDGPKINYTSRKKSRFKGNWAGIELGVNGYLTPSGSIDMPTGYEFMELKYEKSTNFNLNFFQQSFGIFGNKFGFVTGLGLRWNNWRFANNIVLAADSSSFYGEPYPGTDRSYEKSKLTAWYLMMPLMFEFQTNRHHNSSSFHISAGVIGGVRMGSHSKQVYTINGSGDHKPKVYDDFHLQPFILDATMRIGWGPLNLFATYGITEMFRNNRGPALHPFTVGLILPFT